MLFLTYWEVNENMPVAERMSITQTWPSFFLPPRGRQTPLGGKARDGGETLLTEADNAIDVALALDYWRMAGAGFFKQTKTAPATPIAEAMPHWAEAMKAIGGI